MMTPNKKGLPRFITAAKSTPAAAKAAVPTRARAAAATARAAAPTAAKSTPAAGATVAVTYTLKKTSDVAFMSLAIGYTPIDLAADQDPSDANTFTTKGSKKYTCLKEADGIQITCRANGKAGGSWTLTVQLDGTPLADNPIEEDTDGNGHLDHDKKHA